ncbi:MAG: SDR family NAD(P)-dependent oxidoreductase, partial [Alphaproteobacteria bacterium]
MTVRERWTAEAVPDQSGRIAVVTGGNTGLGFETGRLLARKNATVILACRNLEKGGEAVARIKRENPTARCEAMHLDLADLSSVERFVEGYMTEHDHLHLLINNAAVMMPPYTRTRDGFELQLGTNHL